MLKIIVLVLLTTLFSHGSLAEEYRYKNISSRYPDVEFDRQTVKRARMEGECLLGLKKLSFNQKEEVDEWAGFQLALLEQFSPCTVLIIMETAHSKIKSELG